MTPEQFEELKRTISETVKTTVNGKIDRLDKKLDEYIITDNIWKAAAAPAIELGNNVRGFGKTTAYIFGFFVGLATIITSLYEIIKIKVK